MPCLAIVWRVPPTALIETEFFARPVAVSCGADLPCDEPGHPTQHAKLLKQDNENGWKDWCLAGYQCGKSSPCFLLGHVKDHHYEAKKMVALHGDAVVGTYAYKELQRAQWVLTRAQAQYNKYLDRLFDPSITTFDQWEVSNYASKAYTVLSDTVDYIYDNHDLDGLLSDFRSYASPDEKKRYVRGIARRLFEEHPHHHIITGIFDASTYDAENAEKLELARRARIKLGEE